MNKLTLTLIILYILLSISILLRFWNLGYSNFQGDEVKALSYQVREKYEMSFGEYLISNSKAPGQYVVTEATNLFTKPNELRARTPFALAGSIAIILTALLTRLMYGQGTSVLAVIFIGFSGLLVAFSRIVQYQSFVIMFGVLSVYLVALSQRSRPNSYLLLSGFSSALGLLFHYDSLSYIIPIALYLFVRNRKQSYIYLLGLLPILVFYIPYIFSPNFGNTYEYIFGDRISGVFHFDSVHYGVKLLRIYHPDEYLILLAVGLILYFWNISKASSKYILTIMIGLSFLITARYLNETPRRLLTYPSIALASSLIAIFFFRLLKDKNKGLSHLIILWFLFSFSTYMIILSKPLTHIYTMIIPAGILAALGLSQFKSAKAIVVAATIIALTTLTFNYKAYLEGSVEYPWEAEYYILGRMNRSIGQDEKVRGIFGFPYNRSLELIGSSTNTSITNRYFSNEKYDRMRFYMPEMEWSNLKPFYYIEIKDAHEEENLYDTSDSEPIVDTQDYNIYIIQ